MPLQHIRENADEFLDSTSYGEKFHEAASWLGICEVLTAPQSPWQNAYVERLIGSIHREPRPKRDTILHLNPSFAYSVFVVEHCQ